MLSDALPIEPINTRMFTHIGSPIEMPELKAVTAPGGSRVYKVPGGKSYPSVTTILGHKEKPWLADWQQSLGCLLYTSPSPRD